ncbi:acyl-ACP--UDP-N-acetylglucosamine O-acyltransferase [Mesorhizobium sp. CAU 1741]|uniref:acyl-ACP--UDP-N-acetylglucosamine O-acyltransferase n=1 Tax=Mesorhizobium sp. CAU 1741 TaxID=3140366 RepID=UPI00325BA512
MDSETFVHPTAFVEDGAQIGAGVQIGPFCSVGAQVVLGDGVELTNHVSVAGSTQIGAGTKVHAFAALGGPPQDLKHGGGPSRLIIGQNCIIRESVTMNSGTDYGRAETRVGDNCFFLACSHVGHDCIVGDNVTMTNGSMLGGHCEVGDHVIIGGLAAVHQFTRIGRRAFVGGMTGVTGDLIPFGMVTGNRARLRGFNIVGLKRAGVSRTELATLRAAYRMIFAHGSIIDNAQAAREAFAESPAVLEIADFLTSRGKRHFIVPGAGGSDDAADDERD